MVTPTTKYTKKHSRNRGLDSRNDKVVIADNSDSDIKEYICPNPNCRRTLRTRQSKGSYTCLFCQEEFEIGGTRKRSKLETPHKNTETLIGSVPTPHEKDIRIKHEPELQGGFLALSQKGLKIKDYREDIPT